MTGQMHFDSHVRIVTEMAPRLVNALTPGWDGGRAVAVPERGHRAEAVSALLSRPDYQARLTEAEADQFVAMSARLREVFEAANADHPDTAADVVNDLLADTRAAPRLDRAVDGGWVLHFHAAEPGVVIGWGAGIAAGLALAIGSDLVGRLGVCAADGCDRVYVDGSRNRGRRFCSTRCQSRVKAAAHRARSRR